MNSIIYKYPLLSGTGTGGDQVIYLPIGSVPLSVGVQGGQPVLWVMLPNLHVSKSEGRRFKIQTTGNPFDSAGMTFIGTFQIDWFVGHLFEAPL